jgi:small-conductance mechanosensitive channel
MNRNIVLPVGSILMGTVSIMWAAKLVDWNRRFWGQRLSEKQLRFRRRMQIAVGVYLVLFGVLFLVFGPRAEDPEALQPSVTHRAEDRGMSGESLMFRVFGVLIAALGSVTLVYNRWIADATARRYSMDEVGKKKLKILGIIVAILTIFLGLRWSFS